MANKLTFDEETARQLIAAVETALNPSPKITATERFNANHFCNRFKETSSNCAPYGLYLSQKHHSFPVRHVGLQLFEHSIKHQWNDMNPDEKLYVKNSAMSVLAEGTNDLLTEPTHIKDALSRLVVEMIKREWPQQWPDMLKEMKQLACHGETQTELVLFIFLRLAEDIVAFQIVPSQRRRDIQQTLVQSMALVFGFLVDTLGDSVRRYFSSKSENPDSDKSKAYGKVSSSSLLALSGYVEWVHIDHLVTNDAVLIKMLCELLADPMLRQEAVEVLLLVVGRKGKVTDRSPLVAHLFRRESMRALLGAATTVTAQPTDERNLLFLKRLCQVMTSIGTQIHALWGSPETDIPMPPDNFSIFLMALVEFSLHDSQVLNHLTMQLWTNFLGNEHVIKDPNFQNHAKGLVEGLPVKLIKTGYPSADNAPSCVYSKIDFDSDEDFYTFFVKFRADVAMVIRAATKLIPTELIEIAGKWLLSLLADVTAGKTADPLHWEACSILMDNVLGRCDMNFVATRSHGLQLMQELLKAQSTDPVIFSYMLSCMSALFGCLTYGSVEDPTLLAALERIFSAVVFNVPGQNKSTRSRACKNLRRHACSSLVTICKKHATFLMPKFEALCQFITDLDKNASLSQMEKVTLYEALVLISNKFEDFSRQSAFIQSILLPINDIWGSAAMIRALDQNNIPLNFMSHVGVDQPALEPSTDDTCGINRSNLILCLNMIKGVVARSSILDVASLDYFQLTSAKDKGFVVNCPSQPAGAVPVNSATPHVTAYLKNLCLLLKTLNAVWTPAALAKIHPDYSKVLELPEADKRQFIGIIAETKNGASEFDIREPFGCPKNPQERLQQFFGSIYDTTCQILGSCGASLGPQYYLLDGFVSFIVQNVFHNLENIPEYRIRLLNRGFLRPFFVNLLPGQSGVIIAVPILNALCPPMRQRLTTKWEHINNQQVSIEEAEDPHDASNEEVVEEAITRVFTREYFDLLMVVCFTKPGSSSAIEEDMDVNRPPQNFAFLSDVGKAICKLEDLCASILCLIFKALSWRDSSTCNKCAHMCMPLLKEILANHGALPAEIVEEFFSDILRGLRENGQHEAMVPPLLTLGTQFYELLGSTHRSSLANILIQIPGTPLKEVESFHNKFFAKDKPPNDKRKRDLFKTMVDKVVGKHLGQQFKNEVKIKNLPAIFKQKPPKKPLTDVSADEIGLIGLFAPSD